MDLMKKDNNLKLDVNIVDSILFLMPNWVYDSAKKRLYLEVFPTY